MIRSTTGIQPRWAAPAIGAAILGHLLAARTGTDLQVLHLVQAMLPGIFAAAAIKHAVVTRKLSWMSISLFALTYAVAQVGWTLQGSVSGPTQGSSAWNTIYLAGLPFALAGLGWLIFSGMQKGHRLRILLDASVVASSLLLLIWVAFIMGPSKGSPLPDALVEGLPLVAVDVTCTAIAVTAAIYQRRRWFLRWVALSGLVSALLDSSPSLRPYVDPPGSTLKILWMLAPLTLLAATRSWEEVSTRFVVTSDRRSWLYYFVGAAALSIGWAQVRDGGLDAPMVWMGLALILAICANQATQFREVRALMKEAEEASLAERRSEIRFRNAFEGAPVGIAVLDGSVVRSVNPALGRILGLQPHDVIGVDAREFVDTDAVPESTQEDWLPLSGSVEGKSHVFRWQRHDGTDRWIHLTLARQAASAQEHIAILQDITDRQAAHDRLAYLAVTDSLTGLANRPAFLDAVTAALEDDDDIAVAFVDLDRFKAINDTLGHAAGDQVLQAVADRLREVAGADDMVARLAGDEFTLLLRNATTEKVERVLDTASAALRQPVTIDERTSTQPLASIGLAWGRHGIGAEALVARADAAMYRAKASGIHQIAFDRESGEGARRRESELVADLHRGIERDELAIHYQPVVHLASGEVVGHEALVRWQHPTRGLLMPADFLTVAEVTGLIVPMGSWVLHTALHQLARWERNRSGPPLTMSVNVAAPQLRDDFVDQLQRSLTMTGVDTHQIWLEVTESTLMVDVPQSERVIERLRELGVRLSIDDFGTGYSSLSHLPRFPVDGIKIDGAFVSGLGLRHQDDAICQSVISLATGLDLTVVAEGIETPEQLEMLQAMGCTHGQGWLFGRARPADPLVGGDFQLTPGSADRRV